MKWFEKVVVAGRLVTVLGMKLRLHLLHVVCICVLLLSASGSMHGSNLVETQYFYSWYTKYGSDKRCTIFQVVIKMILHLHILVSTIVCTKIFLYKYNILKRKREQNA